MKIRLKNIGLVKDSEVEINGLTVITGDNNTGKTTVGKALYSLIDGISEVASKAEVDKNLFVFLKVKKIIEDILLFLPRANEIVKIGNAMIGGKKDRDVNNKYIDNIISEMNKISSEYIDSDDNMQIVSKIREVIKELENLKNKNNAKIDMSNFIKESVLQTLNTEFFGQIQPVMIPCKSSKITVESAGNENFKIDIVDDKIVNDNIYDGLLDVKNAYFIDNPFVIDDLNTNKYLNTLVEVGNNTFAKMKHNEKLLFDFIFNKTTSTIHEEIENRERYEDILSNINEILPGEFIIAEDGGYYVQGGKKLKISNLATGSKMFAIIKTLLKRGYIVENTVLILDEPEAHLHPAWQNKFVEIIVLLVKTLGIKVLLTTHSPNFVMALDAYVRQYDLYDKTNFYKTNRLSDGMVEYVSVKDDIGVIYDDFVEYLSEVKVIRDKYLY